MTPGDGFTTLTKRVLAFDYKSNKDNGAAGGKEQPLVITQSSEWKRYEFDLTYGIAQCWIVI
jgi:hypothetical protein